MTERLRHTGHSARRPRGRRLRLVVVASAAAAALLAGCSSTNHGVAQPPRQLGTAMNAGMASDITHLPLVTSTGKSTSLSAFAGKTLVISDTMTLCQETCPLDTANLVQTARQVDKAGQGADVEFLTITVDPVRDTPAQLAAYRSLYAPPPSNWLALTGTPANIAKLWKYLGVWYQKVAEGKPPARNWRTGQVLTYDVNHADEVFFLDGKGHERFILDGAAHVEPGTTMPATMRRFLNSNGLDNLSHPQSGTWTVPQALGVVSWLINRELPGANTAAS